MAEEVVDPATGVRFPLFQTFWDGPQLRSLGVGPRIKRIAFIPVKVYSVTLYVDADAAKADLQAAQAAGKLGSDEDVCAALEAGAYTRVLQMQLVRHVTGQQFSDALAEALAPRMKGDEASLDKFKSHFEGKKLDTGTNVVLLARTGGTHLDLLTLEPGTSIADLSQAKPSLSIESSVLVQALWGNYLDASTPSPVARTNWIAGARALLST